MRSQTDFLHRLLLDNQYALSKTTEEQFLQYLDLLTQWNKVFNLTSIRDPKEMVLLHIMDSLSISPYLQGERIIDVGTGAGLPGIPLAVLLPTKRFVLLDSNSKKTRFLTQVVCDLKLPNVEVIHTRCEDFHPTPLFDCILSRAFASLRVMLETTQHLLTKNGLFLAMKGTYPKQEIEEIPQEFQLMTTDKLVIKGLQAERHLICLGKEH